MREIQDPFFEAKENIVLKWSDACRLHDLCLKMLKECDDESSPMLKNSLKQFQEIVDNIENDLVDLEEVVCAIENQPKKYGISNEESCRRRAFVDQIRSNLEQIQKDLDRQFVRPFHSKNKYSNPFLYNEKLANNSMLNPKLAQEYQLLVMNEQDTQLDYVFGTVQNLKEQASILGRELVEQSELIEEIDSRTERMHERLKRGFKNIKRVISQNEG
ncbi:hypothetical protein PORY_000627 [Pneumocystis oryctolagi]|uniref:Uncharacterized protein n=1 Tax=Pneumocystis oryctolagi TaxID=42067 RepID=A0ACB7CD70_9ASCO|nr:hypothetical protein PORY_000627 [Pneumocystis oryctolagi]